MIHGNICKGKHLSSYRPRCENIFCPKNPKYITRKGSIKKDVQCVRIFAADGALIEILCLDCVDALYQKLKPILDRKLWIFI